MTDFSHVLKNPKLWNSMGDLSEHGPLGQGDPRFLYGVATCTFQDSGSHHCPESQWSDWEKRRLPVDNRSEAGLKLFDLYKNQPLEVIKRLKLLSVNCYRFSVEWSHIEPSQGVINHDNLNVYAEFCKILRDHQIQPLVTLHHFSEPRWFHQLGSFEKEENIVHFITFSKLVAEKLIQSYKGEPLVHTFFTINEPGIEAYARYVVGHFSPGLRFRFKRAARFLLNALIGHCEVYKALKELAGDKIRVGFTHQYLKFYPAHPFMHPVAYCLNQFNHAVLDCFQTGQFECKIPFLCNVKKVFNEKPRVDFVGVQFYGRVFLGLKGVDSKDKPETKMLGMYEDPEGLFEAILTVFQAFNVPIMVTENGISTQSDDQRARYLSRALYAAEQARKHIGPQNMLGYILWSFSDNFEWFLGWQQLFGAFSLTGDRNLNEHYKPGVRPFVENIKAWQKTF